MIRPWLSVNKYRLLIDHIFRSGHSTVDIYALDFWLNCAFICITGAPPAHGVLGHVPLLDLQQFNFFQFTFELHKV